MIAEFVWLAAAGLGLGAAVLMRPLAPPRLPPQARPAVSYDEALRLVGELCATDGPDIAVPCRTALKTHGRATPHVVLLLHGLTNCPLQFESLGQLCFERGANVLIPRLPRHGLADRMTREPAKTTTHELCRFADRAMDAAHGLGERVTVVGLSVGGTLAAWVAQNREDVHRAVLVAPMLGLAGIRGPFASLVTRLMQSLPNVFLWWDWRRREKLLGPQQVYPRFSTRAVAATLLVGASVLDAARRTPPRCRAAAVVTVGGDRAVDNRAVNTLAERWRARGLRELIVHEFPSRLRLNHDVIDPEQVGGNPALTYPVLLRLIAPEESAPGLSAGARPWGAGASSG